MGLLNILIDVLGEGSMIDSLLKGSRINLLQNNLGKNFWIMIKYQKND